MSGRDPRTRAVVPWALEHILAQSSVPTSRGPVSFQVRNAMWAPRWAVEIATFIDTHVVSDEVSSDAWQRSAWINKHADLLVRLFDLCVESQHARDAVLVLVDVLSSTLASRESNDRLLEMLEDVLERVVRYE